MKDKKMEDSKEIRILKEDIADLKRFIKKFTKENDYEKARECLEELEKMKDLLKAERKKKRKEDLEW